MAQEFESQKLDPFELKTSQRVRAEIEKINNSAQLLPILIQPVGRVSIPKDGFSNRKDALAHYLKVATLFQQPIIDALEQLGVVPELVKGPGFTGSIAVELSTEQIKSITQLDHVKRIQWNGPDDIALSSADSIL